MAPYMIFQNDYFKKQILLRSLSKDPCQKSNHLTLWPGHECATLPWEAEVTLRGHSNTALPRELCGLRNTQTRFPQTHQAPPALTPVLSCQDGAQTGSGHGRRDKRLVDKDSQGLHVSYTCVYTAGSDFVLSVAGTGFLKLTLSTRTRKAASNHISVFPAQAAH